jgi:hypothetical protein
MSKVYDGVEEHLEDQAIADEILSLEKKTQQELKIRSFLIPSKKIQNSKFFLLSPLSWKKNIWLIVLFGVATFSAYSHYNRNIYSPVEKPKMALVVERYFCLASISSNTMRPRGASNTEAQSTQQPVRDPSTPINN